jgi:hypothetical protein
MSCDDMNDDNYISNVNNAHLPLQCFEGELQSIATEFRQLGGCNDGIVEYFYRHG